MLQTLAVVARLVDGRPLDEARDYRVAANAGIARGLHRYAAFPRGRDRTVHDVSVTTVVEEAFRRRGVLVAPPMNDIRVIPADAVAASGAD